MPDSVEKTTRGVSPILLVLAALCFLLPFVGVSCNTSAGSAALGSALSASGTGANSAGGQQAAQCLQALNGKDLATYSGINLVTGSAPTTATNIPGCDTSGSGSAPDSAQLQVGTQPLLVAALVLMLLGLLATVLRAPLRGFVAGGAALVAAVLVIAANSSVHSAIIDKLTQSGGSNGLQSLGISSSLDSFFNIHGAIGFDLALVALFLAVALNLAAVLARVVRRPAPSFAGGAPPPPPGTPSSAPPPAPFPPLPEAPPPPGGAPPPG